MTIKKAEAHEIRCQGVGTTENEEAELRSEGNNSTSSMHRASNNEEGDENDNEDEEEDDDDDDDGSDSGSGSDSNDAFVENFLRSQNVGASHRRRMRSFYKVCGTYTFAVSTVTHKIQDAHRPENTKNSGGGWRDPGSDLRENTVVVNIIAANIALITVRATCVHSLTALAC